jgi:ABC-type Fe2+-enterobactin transport system substrate-binding protein
MNPTPDNPPPAGKPRRRGGRRPGAGAKPGNLNALKHGRRSAQFSQLGVLLASIPQTWQALLDLARRHQLKQRKAEQVAAHLLEAMMERARAIAERRTINETAVKSRAPQIRHAPTRASSATKPSNRQSDCRQAIKNQIRKTL